MDNHSLGRHAGKALRQGRDVASLVFVALAETGEMFDDTTLVENSDLFFYWSPDFTGKAGTIVRDPDDEKLYRKINADFYVAYPQSQPSKDPSQWKGIGDPANEWNEWSQPLGGHDAYMKGDKVSYGGEHWTSTADNNVWAPGVYGWERVK